MDGRDSRSTILVLVVHDRKLETVLVQHILSGRDNHALNQIFMNTLHAKLLILLVVIGAAIHDKIPDAVAVGFKSSLKFINRVRYVPKLGIRRT